MAENKYWLKGHKVGVASVTESTGEHTPLTAGTVVELIVYKRPPKFTSSNMDKSLQTLTESSSGDDGYLPEEMSDPVLYRSMQKAAEMSGDMDKAMYYENQYMKQLTRFKKWRNRNRDASSFVIKAEQF